MLSAVVVVSMTLLGQARGQEARAAGPDAGVAESAETGDAHSQHAAPLRKARPPRNRGSWDVPKIPTVMGQQSATYEDAIGATTPMPGIVVPAPPEKVDDGKRSRKRDDQKR